MKIWKICSIVFLTLGIISSIGIYQLQTTLTSQQLYNHTAENVFLDDLLSQNPQLTEFWKAAKSLDGPAPVVFTADLKQSLQKSHHFNRDEIYQAVDRKTYPLSSFKLRAMRDRNNKLLTAIASEPLNTNEAVSFILSYCELLFYVGDSLVERMVALNVLNELISYLIKHPKQAKETVIPLYKFYKALPAFPEFIKCETDRAKYLLDLLKQKAPIGYFILYIAQGDPKENYKDYIDYNLEKPRSTKEILESLKGKGILVNIMAPNISMAQAKYKESRMLADSLFMELGYTPVLKSNLK